jgi:hypothetical protein
MAFRRHDRSFHPPFCYTQRINIRHHGFCLFRRESRGDSGKRFAAITSARRFFASESSAD